MTNNVVAIDPWKNATLSGCRRGQAQVTASALLRFAETGCHPALMVGSDGRRYWVKYQQNPHGQLSLLAERIVAAVSAYLSGPVPDASLINIPKRFHGVKVLDTEYVLHQGPAHASLEVSGQCTESYDLSHIPKDGNRFRAPKAIALWEWCFGDDEQWLYVQSEDHQLWTFDHGMWLGGGGEWTIDSLKNTYDVSAGWDGNVRGMDAGTFLAMADKIESCTVADLLSVVATVPLDWGFTDNELIDVAYWLDRRRNHVATNLRKHSTNV